MSGNTATEYANPISGDSQDESNPQFRSLRAVHENYAHAVETALSAFLRVDLAAELRQVSSSSAGAFIRSLPSPTCLMLFRLHPRKDEMFLHMDCATVFRLLELLLGGTGSSVSAPRTLTEIEWSLLEEVVRVMVRPLGEAWKSFAPVQFEVESLVAEPTLLPMPAPGQGSSQPMVRMVFELGFGEKKLAQEESSERPCFFEILAPQAFFDTPVTAPAVKPETPRLSLPQLEQQLGRLEHASVAVEVLLEGPAVSFQDLVALKPNDVLSLDYPVDLPLSGVLEGGTALQVQIVSTGHRRAFRVIRLPDT